jgi:hypothetical protein
MFILRFFVWAAILSPILIAFSAYVSFTTDLVSPFTTFSNTILLAFDSTEGGGVIRKLQSDHLFDFLSEAPLLGHGLNSHPNFIRSVEEPWSYEWVYLAFLAQNGLIASISMFVVISFVLMSSFRRVRLNPFLPVHLICLAIVNGSVCFFVAGSSNPMIYFSWFWFLFFLLINQRLFGRIQ